MNDEFLKQDLFTIFNDQVIKKILSQLVSLIFFGRPASLTALISGLLTNQPANQVAVRHSVNWVMSPRQKRTKRSLPNGAIKAWYNYPLQKNHCWTPEWEIYWKSPNVFGKRIIWNCVCFLVGKAEVSDHHEIVKTGDDDCHLQLRVSHEPPWMLHMKTFKKSRWIRIRP